MTTLHTRTNSPSKVQNGVFITNNRLKVVQHVVEGFRHLVVLAPFGVRGQVEISAK
jgi:hypothetical protein